MNGKGRGGNETEWKGSDRRNGKKKTGKGNEMGISREDKKGRKRDDRMELGKEQFLRISLCEILNPPMHYFAQSS
jgi:hypothetical protein